MKRKLEEKKTNFQCDVCFKYFSRKDGLENHKKYTHEKTEEFQCDICFKYYAYPTSLSDHKRFVHDKQANHTCLEPNCGKSFPTPWKLKRHENVHVEYKRYECEFMGCGRSFAEKYQLSQHIMTHTNDFPFVCNHENCKEKFGTEKQLKDHSNKHTGETPYKCDECEDSFGQPDSLKHHKVRRHGERTYECEYCDSSFFFSGELLRHQITHTREYNYICQEDNCEQAFSNSYGLDRHMLTDIPKEKNVLCDECDYKCDAECKLRVHKLRHARIKTHKCDICGKLFVTKTELSRHRTGHTDIKDYKCSHCIYRTDRSDNLQRHERIHELQASYEFPCQMQDGGDQLFIQGDIRCSIRCKTERDMEIHIQNNHTQEGLHKKLQSEEKMAQFLKVNNIEFSREWFNFIGFKNCGNVEGNKQSARPDFFLLEESTRLGALVFLENDEFSHRLEACDFQRIFNIVNSLDQTEEFQDLPILFIRFNPHHYRKDGKYFDPSLKSSHELMLSTLREITKVKEGVNLVYINYDSTNGELDIFKDIENDYAKIYKDCVLLSVCAK